MFREKRLALTTLCARNAKLTATLEARLDSDWTTIMLDAVAPTPGPPVHEDTVTEQGYPKPLRQIAVRGLGHDYPTLVLTNNRTDKPPAWLTATPNA